MATRPTRLRSSSGARCGTWAWTRLSRRSCSASTTTATPATGAIPGGHGSVPQCFRAPPQACPLRAGHEAVH
eukprot:4101137-Alexandrium_andersonii.AAC.1